MRFLEWLRRRAREAGSSSEEETARDGAFSWKAETHAAATGAGAGVVTAIILATGAPVAAAGLPAVAVVGWALRVREPPEEPHLRDVAREPAYALAATALSTLLTLALLSALGLDVATLSTLLGAP